MRHGCRYGNRYPSHKAEDTGYTGRNFNYVGIVFSQSHDYGVGKSNIGLSQFGEQKVDTLLDKISQLFGMDAGTANVILGVIIAIAIIAVLYWFFGTELGSLIRATGINENMVRAQGGNTDVMKIIGLVVSNGFVALSGALVAQIQRYGDVGMGTGTIVIGLASIIIGEVLLGKKGSFKVRLISVFLGSILYRVIIAIVLLLGSIQTT